MFASFKINTAVIICTAFIFRLLFVNIGIISSLNTQQNHGIIKNHFSSAIKKRRNIESSTNSGSASYVVTEICEEDTDDEKAAKPNPFLFIQVLYSFLSDKINNTLEKIAPFYNYLSYKSSHRYLAFQVFRI
jgi:hypothetical protein